ncbi:recombinase family protein [Pseudomonas sp. P8_241]|uniref:recombinase family protein n=1 Tax=Pseudomonas sp. P8_241 TaxID=3043445 RepID=UPI002A36E754|nr:recombinase family protein [Pseudomonas sp. P8_241]WPN48669.1 recombinase family protein [Pseudomonas sp. P8_241]
MPVAYSYIRFSSAQQQHGASLARQQEMVGKWLVANPTYTRSELSFQDLGKSGWSGEHLDNAFGRLLAAVENGVIKAGDVVLIEAIDRAGRLEPMEMLPLLSKIVNAGVDIVSLDDGITYNRASVNSNHLFLLVAKVQQAYNYSDNLSRRVKDAYARKRVKAAKGEFTERRTPLWLENTGTEVKLVADLAPFIVQIFQDYAAGIGERRILARVRGKHPLLETLNPTTIKKWLRNPTAIGRWQPWPVDGVEQTPIEDVYPAVVSKELWYRVQKQLESGAKIKGVSKVYLLSGLVVCGRCGKNFGVVDTKRSPAAMLCMSRHRLGEAGCTNSKSIPYSVLEYILSNTYYEPLERALAGQHLTAGEKREIEIEGELVELRKQSENAAEGLVKYGMLKAITDVLDKVTASIQALEEERALLKTAPPPPFIAVINAQYDLRENDPVKLGALLRGAGYKIICDGGDIVVNEAVSNVNDLPVQKFQYSRFNRKTGLYELTENGYPVTHLHMVGSAAYEKIRARDIAVFEKTGWMEVEDNLRPYEL